METTKYYTNSNTFIEKSYMWGGKIDCAAKFNPKLQNETISIIQILVKQPKGNSTNQFACYFKQSGLPILTYLLSPSLLKG